MGTHVENLAFSLKGKLPQNEIAETACTEIFATCKSTLNMNKAYQNVMKVALNTIKYGKCFLKKKTTLAHSHAT